MRLRLTALAVCLTAQLLTSPAYAHEEDRVTITIEQTARLATRWFEEGRIEEARRLLASPDEASGTAAPPARFP